MGTALFSDGHTLTRVVLTETTLIGRHWRCDVQATSASVPLYWVEIRWLGEAWGWRSLSVTTETVGKGAFLSAQWRRWEVGATIRLGESVSLQLRDDAPPSLVLEHLLTGERIDGDAVFDWVRLTDEGPCAVDADGETLRPLADGDRVELRGAPFRIWWPSAVLDTPLATLSLRASSAGIDVDLRQLVARFHTDVGDLLLRGPLVRLLAVYVKERVEGTWDAHGGWPTNQACLTRWQALGGPVGSAAQRLNWERHRLLSQLVALGLDGTPTLFERRRQKRVWSFRIALSPERLRVVGADD